MNTLPSRILVGALRFIEGLHEVSSRAALRAAIPAGLAALIPCSRASLNEVTTHRRIWEIVPSPLPGWWGRLGSLYQKHGQEHPVWHVPHPLHKVVTFSDFARCAFWKNSTLFHEYFLKIGVRHQMGAITHVRDGDRVAVALNRDRGDFSAPERTLLALLSPHVSHALRSHDALLQAEDNGSPGPAAEGTGSHVLLVRTDGGRVAECPPAADQLLRLHFAGRVRGGVLPPEVVAWLRARVRWLRGVELTIEPAAELIVHRPGSRLVIRLAGLREGQAVLLLVCEPTASVPRAEADPLLTHREREILRWASEGKRDAEIGIILGISPRTVSKHLENSFRKLGVETRTAAIRQWEAGGPHSHA